MAPRMAWLSVSGVRSPKKSASSLQIGALSQTPRQPFTTWTVNSPSAVVSPSAIPDVFQILNQPLRAHDVTRHAVAKKHEVLAARLGAKVCIERQEPIDAGRGGAEVMRYDLGGVQGHPAEVLIDFLKGGKDELLRFLKVAVPEMGEDPPDFVEIDSVFVIGFAIRFCRLLRFGTGDRRRHVFHCCP